MAEQIVTLTMNPAVDLCTGIDRLMPSHKLRCGPTRHDAGGGGINVARVVRRFGGDPLAIFPSGGPMGHLLERLVAVEAVRYRGIPVAGDTREDITIDEHATASQYRFVLPGPILSTAETQTCLDALAAVLMPSGFVVASGSLPPGVPPEFYADVAVLAASRGARFVLDSSGPGLKAATGRGLYLIKPSLREFSELLSAALSGERECADAARQTILAGGAEYIALTLGEGGAMLVSRDVTLAAAAPKVIPVSTVGAGDSFLGALVFSLMQGRTANDALRYAVAAGTAALLAPGTDLCRIPDVERLARDIQVREI
jgi:6-phosphofructokinase 2